VSWHYLQGREAASWAGFCWAGVPSALSRLIPTAGRYCSHGSETDCSHRFPSGMTSPPSTDDLGAATSTSSAAASPVRTSAPPDTRQESPAPAAASGLSTLASLAKFDPASHSWKTPQLSLFGDWTSCSVIWPRWGFMLAGECWALDTLERHISAIASGLSRGSMLQTPTSFDARTPMSNRGKGTLSQQSDRLQRWQMLPTPTKFDATGNVTSWRGRGSLRQRGDRIQRWDTPSRADAHSAAYNRTGPYEGLGQKHLQAQAFERLTPLDSPTGKLNPEWVEWLMGWPMRWTDLAPLETDKFRQWYESHGRPWPDAPGVRAEEPPASDAEAGRG